MKISPKCIPYGRIDNKSAFVQTTAWRLTGDLPLFEHMMAQIIDTYLGHSASLSQDSYPSVMEISFTDVTIYLPPANGEGYVVISVGLFVCLSAC